MVRLSVERTEVDVFSEGSREDTAVVPEAEVASFPSVVAAKRTSGANVEES